MPKKTPRRPSTGSERALRREIARLTAALEAAEERHRRRLAAVRRAADRRLAAVVQEIAALRHHQARAEALARILAERGDEAPRPTKADVSSEATAPASR